MAGGSRRAKTSRKIAFPFDNIGVKEYSFATDLSLTVTAAITEVQPGEMLGVEASVVEVGRLAAADGGPGDTGHTGCARAGHHDQPNPSPEQ